MELLKKVAWHSMWAVVRGVIITLLVVAGAVAWRQPAPAMRPAGPPRRIEPVPGVEGLVLRSATCTRVVLRTDRALQMQIMKEHLAPLYSKFVSVRQRTPPRQSATTKAAPGSAADKGEVTLQDLLDFKLDGKSKGSYAGGFAGSAPPASSAGSSAGPALEAGPAMPNANGESDRFTKRWGDLLWSSLAEDFGADGVPYHRLPESTWGIPTWCPICVGWDARTETAWTAQISDGYGWPFHAMKSTVVVAELAEAPPYWKVETRGSSPLFETEAWPCTSTGLTFSPWQKGAVPLTPIPFGMAVDVMFWGALSYLLVVMQWGVMWVVRRVLGRSGPGSAAAAR